MFLVGEVVGLNYTLSPFALDCIKVPELEWRDWYLLGRDVGSLEVTGRGPGQETH